MDSTPRPSHDAIPKIIQCFIGLKINMLHDVNEPRCEITLLPRGINVKHLYCGVVQVQDPSGMDLLKLTCKQKENWIVEKVIRMFTVLSFISNHNL